MGRLVYWACYGIGWACGRVVRVFEMAVSGGSRGYYEGND